MIHNPSVGIWGDEDDLRKEADVLKKLKDSAIDIYASRMKGWSKEDISALMDDETWYTAKEALSVGLIDEIIDPIEVEEPETNRSDRLPSSIGKSVFVNYKQDAIPPVKEPESNKGENIMKCPSCGKDHGEGAVFCSSCGKPMDNATSLKMAADRERNEAVVAERERVKNITALAGKHSLEAKFVDELISGGKSYEECAVKILEKIDVPPPVQHGVVVKKDGSDKFIGHATNCLMVFSGMEKDPTKMADVHKDVPVESVHSLLRMSLERSNVKCSHMNDVNLVDTALSMLGRGKASMSGTGSSDLPLILENVITKSMVKGTQEADTTYKKVAGVRRVNDFRENNIVDISGLADIKEIPEGSSFEDSKRSDSKETFGVSTKGRMRTITRNALINDDMGALTNEQYKFGVSVETTKNYMFYQYLTQNAMLGKTMGDGNALFHTAHSNIKTTSGIPSVSSLDTARKMLREMPMLAAENGVITRRSNVPPKFLLTGTTMETAVQQLLGTSFDPSKAIAGVVNPFYSSGIILVSDADLQGFMDTNSKGNAWYILADQMRRESIGIAYLNGMEAPVIRSIESGVGEALGIKMDVYHDFGFYVAGWRGIIYNDGTTGG